MDGNGRWAKARGKERIYGHFEGVESVRACTEACVEEGVKYLSLYAFSEENWKRPDEEVAGLMSLMAKCMANELPTFLKNGVLILFMSYSGKWDIFQAAKKMALKAAESPEALDRLKNAELSFFDSYLVTAGIPDPDLIIRTSGETRLSNYLLWQAAYSEFLFTETLWPDFRKPEFRAALESYAKRDRRYGKVK